MEHHWLIVGLGNPEPRYNHTRHNVGEFFLRTLHEQWNGTPFSFSKKVNGETSSCPVHAPRPEILLLFPHTYMNASGGSVGFALRFHDIPLSHLLVLHDEKDLPFGTWKLQQNRGAAGHHGVESVLHAMGTQDFWRLRIGIGVTPQPTPTDHFVLERFSQEEQIQLTEKIFPNALLEIEHLIAAS